MNRLNVFATEEEKQEILKLHKEAQTTPCFGLSTEQCLSGNDFASMAWKRLRTRVNEIAKTHGLPDTIGDYGFDGENGEFITV